MVPNNCRSLETFWKKYARKGQTVIQEQRVYEWEQYFAILLYLFTLSIFSPARVVTAMIISLCNTNSNRVWNQLRCIKLNWEYMSTSVTYSRLKNLRIFLSLFIKIRKLLLKISTDIPTNISTNISFPAVWNKFPIKKHKQISLFWSKVYIKKSVLKLTS